MKTIIILLLSLLLALPEVGMGKAMFSSGDHKFPCPDINTTPVSLQTYVAIPYNPGCKSNSQKDCDNTFNSSGKTYYSCGCKDNHSLCYIRD